MAEIWLVRHARPVIAAGTCYGRLDVAADSQATWQAATALAQAIPAGFRLVTSPLQRCVQLAGDIGRLRPDIPQCRDSRLAEMDFGDWEGRLWTDLGASALAQWTADFAGFAPGGGETVKSFMDRVAEALEAWRRQDTVWITHAGVIRAVSLLSAGRREVRSAEEWPSGEIGFGSFTVFRSPVVHPGPTDTKG